MSRHRILSGMRPTGKLHLGNYAGALSNWVSLQEEYECFFMIADWHALTDRTDTREIRQNIRDVLIDWLCAGLDPEKSTIFVQSHIPEHAELHLILSMITPLGWLERCPAYKEKLASGGENNYGLLGYPVLMSSDILIYKADKVPVGDDQLAHLELCREIARRFNSLYGRVLPEPQPLLSRATRILGLDGRKMSKSYDNYIALSDEPGIIESKVQKMFTDPEKVYAGDSGHPERCNVYSYHKAFGKPLGEDVEKILQECKSGKLGCVTCKNNLSSALIQILSPFRKRRRELEGNTGELEKILREGREKARQVAGVTLEEVKGAMQMSSL